MLGRSPHNSPKEQTLERALAEVEALAHDQLEGKKRATGRALEVEALAHAEAEALAEEAAWGLEIL